MKQKRINDTLNLHALYTEDKIINLADAAALSAEVPARDVLADAIALTRAARGLLMIAAEGAALSVDLARLGQPGMTGLAGHANPAGVEAVTKAAGRLFQRCRQVRSVFPEVTLRINELLKVASNAGELETFADTVYRLSKYRLLAVIHDLTLKTVRLAETIQQTCVSLQSVRQDGGELERFTESAQTLGRIASRLERAIRLESV
ncbi:hypothetical protein ACP3TJ_06705 [Desulforudis sp. 1088]|uniref:hypothetical protein n=1 Tax=unclassified Candidatus Desulforudis TaxID=2635950 RepID=UPI00349B5BD9